MRTLFSGYPAHRDSWAQIGVRLPGYDREHVIGRTAREPVWLHFGAGNIFRAFIARLQHDLLEKGFAEKGIIVTETFDPEIIDRVYSPFDDLSLIADLEPGGKIGLEVLGSVTESVPVDACRPRGSLRLREIATSPSLQIISLTITEKGYTLRDKDGALLPDAKNDMISGPSRARHTIGVLCSLLFDRYKNSGAPLSVVSMDNCSKNGDVLRGAVLEIAHAWVRSGHADPGFVDYLSDDSRIAFPWSMIDKITPRPSEQIFEHLTDLEIADMEPVVTSKGTYIAPFVNAEIPQYLVIEDLFPNGRPALEHAGVLFADRDTVERAERMKVSTCLNPLHTALAVFGCLLGYTRISDEMRDADLLELVKRIGYVEGLPVVADPKILNPEAFLREVIEERLPNPYIPDAPQRIATDTSQKMPIRFGQTILSYMRSENLDASTLTFIPLTIAAWLRYLLAIDDSGEAMQLSSDPLLDYLTSHLEGIELGAPERVGDKLRPLLSDETLFGVDLYACGSASKIKEMFARMLTGNGAVRETLRHYLATDQGDSFSPKNRNDSKSKSLPGRKTNVMS
ncbi:MAG: mannitol dehydrogenase family protein [Clostridiales bacterium]|nr:mannitol dehydrogenase family protein [Clostridiales bacterium]